MPIVGGLANQYEYRCDGSDNSGGLQAPEMLAMAVVSLSRIAKGTTAQEQEYMTILSTVAEDWLAPAPNDMDHSMSLFPHNTDLPIADSEDTWPGCTASTPYLRIIPISLAERELTTTTILKQKIQEYLNANETEEIPEDVRTQLSQAAELETPIVSVQLVSANEDFVSGSQTPYDPTIIFSDDTTWTWSLANLYGFLTMINSTWAD